MFYKFFPALALVALLGAFTATLSNAEAKPPKRVLVVTVTKGFRHGSIPVAEATTKRLPTEVKANSL
jgi:hypothetical protein